MSRKMLIRADDLGYSEGVNYGIAKAVGTGIIRSVGVMTNMPAAEHGLNLLKGMPVCLGQHTNICAGYPLTDPKRIPSLVQENGQFKTSAQYRMAETDLVELEEVILEIEAQLQRFVELTGRRPDYFECHAVTSKNLEKGLQIVADRYHLDYLPIPQDGSTAFRGIRLKAPMEFMKPDYDPMKLLRTLALEKEPEDPCVMVVFHPGYLDDYILTHSSLTIPRTKEVAACCTPGLKEWLEENQVELISFNDL